MQRIVFNPVETSKTESVVTIGNFDGLHLGHQELLRKMHDVARQNNYRTIVITFEPLPLEYFFDQGQKPRLPRLSFLRDKVGILQKLSYIDELVIIHFNAAIANLSPQDFIRKVLQQQLNVCHAVIGYDFKFGKNGIGCKQDLVQSGINVTNVEPYLVKNTLISSSLLRDLANNNELSKIREYLGRNLHYTGRVIYGKQLGRQYNVPTINLSLGQNKPALQGIYIARVSIEGSSYNAVASIGQNPTTSKALRYNLEAHLLDVDMDLYGKIATVEILAFMRSEEKFIDLDTLFRQIHLDIQKTREYFTLLHR